MTKKDIPNDGPQNEPEPEAQNQASPIEDQLMNLTEALQRERADALNLRRRHESDLKNLGVRVKSNTINELLPVIDNFERALKHVPADLEKNDYIKGVQGIVRQFEKSLEKLGVERIKTVGKPFDPKYHEAISMEEGSGEHEIVSEELQAGYHIGDDVIRHAMVRVKNQ